MNDDEELIGTVIDGRFRVDAQLGAGGMGVVYRATQLNVEREVAIKVLSAEISRAGGDIVQRFEREARTIARLRHPNTLRLIDFGRTASGRLYIATELLHGEPLNVILSRGPLSARRTARLLHQIVSAMEEFHAAGIIHRDLKPANVIVEKVNADDFARVLDFGIARDDAVPALTLSQMLLGTPAYMSPEQARGEVAGPSSDLYSLGVIGYECLTGRPPFLGDAPLAILLKHVGELPTPLSNAVAPGSVPAELTRLVMQLLEKQPSARPTSAAEVRRRLERIDEGPTQAGPIVGTPAALPPLYLAPATPELPSESLHLGLAKTHIPARASSAPITDSRPFADPASIALEHPEATRRRSWFVALALACFAAAAALILGVQSRVEAPVATVEALPSAAPALAEPQPAPTPSEAPVSILVDASAQPSTSDAATPASAAPGVDASTSAAPTLAQPSRPRPSPRFKPVDQAPPTPVVEAPAPVVRAKVTVMPLLSSGVAPAVDVFVNGARHGRGSTVELELEPGAYRIGVVGADGVTRERVLTVKAGDVRREMFILD